MQIQKLSDMIQALGFKEYGSFNEEDGQHDILTCTERGNKYDGEVVDLYWDYKTGEVTKVEQSTQFMDQQPTLALNVILFNPGFKVA